MKLTCVDRTQTNLPMAPTHNPAFNRTRTGGYLFTERSWARRLSLR